MAWITGLEIIGTKTKIISSSEKRSVARLQYVANFTDAEVRLRIPFDEEIRIFEIDAAVDRVWEEPSSDVAQQGTFRIEYGGSNRDNERGVSSGIQLMASATPIERDLEIPFVGGGEKGNEEYRALVRLEPLVARAWQWSNMIKRNLD